MSIGTAILTAALLAQAQDPAGGQRSGVISGRVIDAGTGRAVSAALVSIVSTAEGFSSANPVSPILTDANGRFVFDQLRTPQSFHVDVKKGGFADGGFGRNGPDGESTPLELRTAQAAAEITIRLWKLGVITGTVLDEAGEAVVGVQVRAIARRPGAARSFTGPVFAVSTDDRGVYRLGQLLPGEYLVVASTSALSAPAGIFADVARTGRGAGSLAGLVSAGTVQGIRVGDALYGATRGAVTPPPSAGTRMRIYPPTFHPGATSPAQGSIVTVGSGEERVSIDIHLAPVATSRVSGSVFGPSGPAGMATLRLVPAGGDVVSSDVLSPTGVADASGGFVFPAVVPGSYVLRNDVRSETGLTWLAMPIAVAGDDIDGIVATLQPALKVTARMQFEGTTPAPAPATGRATAVFVLEADDGPPITVQAVTGAEGLTVAGYPPGRYRIRVMSSPDGWMFKAAMLDGVDVSQTPFDLTRDVTDLSLVFTDRWSGISGAVQGERAEQSVVILFPTDSQAWANSGSNPRRLRSARVDTQGRFTFTSVPPGDYFVVAVPGEQSRGWREPAMLENLARIATQQAIVEGEHKRIDLRVREVRQ